MMSRISIAMATYNGGRHIREQLDSLARQISLPYELVITDDGSTDGTLTILEEFARRASFPVHLYQNKHRLGATRNFLLAAALCTGDWIAFCDQDDLWLRHKLAVVRERITRFPDAFLVVHSAMVTDENLVPTGIRVPRFACDRLVPLLGKANGFIGHAMVFRSELIAVSNAVGYPTDKYYKTGLCGHDCYIFLLANAFGPIVEIAEDLGLYRRHGAAVTSWYQYGDAKLSAFDRVIQRLMALKTSTKDDTFVLHHRLTEWSKMLGECVLNDPVLADRAKQASGFYKRIAELFGTRTLLYSRNRLVRVKGLAQLVRRSAYRSKTMGGFGVVGLASDVVKLIA